MKFLLIAFFCLALNRRAKSEKLSFTDFVSQYCTGINLPSDVPGPPGPQGPPGRVGPEGKINETTIRRIVSEEIQKALPVFRNISELLTENETVAAEVANEYKRRVIRKGKWIVFQRRMDGSVSFNRRWKDYENGFGNKNGEFWLGLKELYRLTKDRVNELRIDMYERDGTPYYAYYKTFEVGPPSDKYRIRLKGYYGNSSKNAMASTSGNLFSTIDKLNCGSWCKCPGQMEAGWWYYNDSGTCYQRNVNGLYGYFNRIGLAWGDGDLYLRFVEMKFRPRI